MEDVHVMAVHTENENGRVGGLHSFSTHPFALVAIISGERLPVHPRTRETNPFG